MLEIPEHPGYFALSTGHIRKPNGCITPGTLRPDGYRQICIKYKYYLVHNLIASAYVFNPRPDIFLCVDHINGNRSDNVPSNLRYLTNRLNCLNSKASNCSFYKPTKKWRAYFHKERKFCSLGYYDTKEEAMKIGQAARRDYFEHEYNRLRNSPIEM